MTNHRIDPLPALHSLGSTLALGFKFLAWINGTGIVIALLSGMGVISSEFAPQWMRLPLAAFLGGLTFSALGLLWSYPVQASLLNQLMTGRTRRSHWIPLFCAMVAYSLALLAFVCGCWLMLGLAGAVYQGPDDTSSADDLGVAPFDQMGDAQEFIYDAKQNTIRFF